MSSAESTAIEDVTALVEAEFDRLDERNADGELVAGWVKADYSGAFLVRDCADEEALIQALTSLPTSVACVPTLVTEAVLGPG